MCVSFKMFQGTRRAKNNQYDICHMRLRYVVFACFYFYSSLNVCMFFLGLAAACQLKTQHFALDLLAFVCSSALISSCPSVLGCGSDMAVRLCWSQRLGCACFMLILYLAAPSVAASCFAVLPQSQEKAYLKWLYTASITIDHGSTCAF